MPRLDVLIVGPKGNTHIASSFERAAKELGLAAHVEDTALAYHGPSVLRSLLWRVGGRRPYSLDRFSTRIEVFVEREFARILVTIGQAPVTARTLFRLRARGVRCMSWLTDDPWNPTHMAAWHLASLRQYDVTFTTRRSNIKDLRSIGCAEVHYLPFAYDPALFQRQSTFAHPPTKHEVLFVGGADSDRAKFVRAFMQTGPALAVVGGYWDRFSDMRVLNLGHKSAAELCELTAGAAVNLCLVRRANRDGHVMRSFEIPAIGGFMLAEDTEEHRTLFGREGEQVLYFRSPAEAAEKACWALVNPAERARMAANANRAVTRGRNTYKDRLQQMLEAVPA